MIQYASSLLFLRRLKVFSAQHRRYSGDGRGRPWRISRTILDLLILAIFVTIVVAKSLLVTRMICLRCAMYGPECFGHDAAPVHLVCPPICLLSVCVTLTTSVADSEISSTLEASPPKSRTGGHCRQQKSSSLLKSLDSQLALLGQCAGLRCMGSWQGVPGITKPKVQIGELLRS